MQIKENIHSKNTQIYIWITRREKVNIPLRPVAEKQKKERRQSIPLEFLTDGSPGVTCLLRRPSLDVQMHPFYMWSAVLAPFYVRLLTITVRCAGRRGPSEGGGKLPRYVR